MTGIDPKKTITSYAASVDQVRRSQDRQDAAAGARQERRSRWPRTLEAANPKLKPEIVPGEHFMMFSNLPSERASSTLKAHGKTVRPLEEATSVCPRPIGLKKSASIVFSNRKDFIEFVRTVEKHEVEADTLSSGQLSIDQPYLAVVDPAGGKKEEPASRQAEGRRTIQTRRRRGDGQRRRGSKPGRNSHRGVGQVPRWRPPANRRAGWRWASALTWLAKSSRRATITGNCVKPPSPISVRAGRPGRTRRWAEPTRSPRTAIHAVGFALVEAMMSEMRQGFPAFVNGMLQGGKSSMRCFKQVYGGTRDEFLDGTGEWVASHYGHLQ